MSVKITTLIENNPGEHLGLKAEHGISFLSKKMVIKFSLTLVSLEPL